MIDRDRLIKILSVPICPRIGADPAEVVADYLLDNGVIVPPCKVGDVLYDITLGDIRELMVESIPIMIYRGRIRIGVNATNYREAMLLLDSEDFGKEVFLTREEAEKALAERSEST